jgi:hypothetical protein
MDTFSLATAFAEGPLQIKQAIHTLNRACGRSSSRLQNIALVCSIPAIHQAIQKVRASHFEKRHVTYDALH